jgi:isoleucyl-tRNA synthetase
VDYSADVPLGPGIVKQLADVYRKVRNTARYLLGNLHDFDPRPQTEGGNAIAIEDLPLLDRWMLQRTAVLIDAVSVDFERSDERFEERFEFYRFFQALQKFCVVDLSNIYLDIAKDRLYVSAANSFRRRSCQTVLSLVVERLAVLIAPVLCHMAEDIWQNLPYPVAEKSVFERGWPTADNRRWLLGSNELHNPDLTMEFTPFQLVKDLLEGLRPLVNRQLEACRRQQAGITHPQGSSEKIGSSLETQVQLELAPGEEASPVAKALALLKQSPNPEVDNLADWLLVSSVQIGGEPPAQLLAQACEAGVTVRIAKAAGQKCERCWHYETDIGDHAAHPTLCGRCVAVLAENPPK